MDLVRKRATHADLGLKAQEEKAKVLCAQMALNTYWRDIARTKSDLIRMEGPPKHSEGELERAKEDCKVYRSMSQTNL